MYKYEQRRKSLKHHYSGSVKRKGTIEFKRDLSTVPKVNVQKAMGVSENIAKNSVYVQRAEIDKRTIQLSRRIKKQQSLDPQPLLQPDDEQESDYKIIVKPATLLDGQENNILQFPRQSPIRVGSTQYYHMGGRYPPGGKPIWVIHPGNKIEIIGMYRHGATNRIYLKNRGTGNGPDRITI